MEIERERKNMAKLLYGEDFANRWKTRIKHHADSYTPKLVIVTSGDDAASKVYIRNKVKLAEELGIKCEVVHVDNVYDVSDVYNRYVEYGYKVIIQKPYAKHLRAALTMLQDMLPSYVDVDGLNKDSDYIPCTARAVMEMLKYYDLTGKHVVIVGRSELVGKPLINLCLDRNATVTSCNSYTRILPEITSQADVLISAVGKPKFITEKYVKEGAIVIDVGINRDENGKLCGDVDFDNVAPKCLAITPVPKGVGPMTVTMLMANVVGL